MSKTEKLLPPVHPGEILREEFMVPMELSMNKLAQAIHVPMNRISAIVNGKRGITGDTALRFARYWGTSPEYWMNLQSHYELEVAKDAIGSEVSAIKHHSAAA